MSNEVFTGHVIVAAGQIEKTLKRLGATGLGLHDMVAEVEAKLSPETVKKIRFIAAVRNKLAHGETLTEPVEPAYFDTVFNAVMLELTRLTKETPPPKSTLAAPSPRSKPEPPPSPLMQEVDEEFRNTMYKRLRLCGFLPIFNIVYFTVLTIRGIIPAIKPLVLLIMFIISVPMLIEGFRQNDKLYLFSGIGFMSLYWLVTIIYALSQRRMPPKLKWFWWITPILSVRYLVQSFHFYTNYSDIVLGILPLFALSFLPNCLILHYYQTAAIIFGLTWLYGIILVLCNRGERRPRL